MVERKLLGENLTFEEQITLAQLTSQPGWAILVRMMAEACRNATEAVIKLDPQAERYNEKLAGLQTTARAMNKFSTEVLDSVKVHNRRALEESERKNSPVKVVEKGTRFEASGGFKPPVPKLVKQSSSTEGEKKE